MKQRAENSAESQFLIKRAKTSFKYITIRRRCHQK